MSISGKESPLVGGVNITVKHQDGTGEEVFIKEVTPDDVLNGEYIIKLRYGIMDFIEWWLGKESGWARTLTRESWTLLRKTEEELNFDFARCEMEAALAAGLKSSTMEGLMRQTAELMETIYLDVLQVIAMLPESQSSLPGRGLFPGSSLFSIKRKGMSDYSRGQSHPESISDILERGIEQHTNN